MLSPQLDSGTCPSLQHKGGHLVVLEMVGSGNWGSGRLAGSRPWRSFRPRPAGRDQEPGGVKDPSDCGA